MKGFYFSLALLILLLGACKKDVDTDQFQIDIQKIEDYISANNLQAEKLPSGVYYIIEKEGTGTENPNLGSTIVVYYQGYLLDGTVFDETGVDPLQIGLSQVILGWQDGLQQFKKGGKGKLLIPSTMGYGGRELGSIPANSVLIFDIELEDFF